MKAALLGVILFSAFLLGSEPPQPLVLAGGTLIDVSNFGKSQSDITNAVVVIQGGKIVAAGAKKEVRVPAKAQVIRVAGKYIVPGLINGFSIQNNQAQANAHLYMGVTSIVGIPDKERRGPLYLDANPSPRIYGEMLDRKKLLTK